MKRIPIIIGLLFAVGGLFWLFPLFHVVRLHQAGASQRQAEFNAADFTKAFWTERLVPAFDQTPDINQVLAAIMANPDQARDEFGRSVGLGRTALYFVHGSGTVISVDERGVGVALGDDADAPNIVLQTGLVSGNNVRDATGLLSASEYPNSQEFNDISTELNRIVEKSVIANLKEQAKVGRRVEFVGCAKVLNLPNDVKPLKIIPLNVRFE